MATVDATPATRSPRGRRARRATGDERERAILETAERLLAERPIHEISVDDLARGAGISRPTFYFYFSSKEAVLLALLDRVVEEARASRGDVLERPGEDPPRRLRQAINGIYETFRSHRAVMLAAADAGSASPEVRELWATRHGGLRRGDCGGDRGRARSGRRPRRHSGSRSCDLAQPDERARPARDLRRARPRGRGARTSSTRWSRSGSARSTASPSAPASDPPRFSPTPIRAELTPPCRG